MSDLKLSEAFWQFSIELYAQPNISNACLNLQDTHHCNVNILLFCCWLTNDEYSLSKGQLEEICKHIGQSERIIQKHRTKRLALKHSANQSEYQLAKEQELALEREQQCLIIEAWKQIKENTPNTDYTVDPLTCFARYYQFDTSTQYQWVDPIREKLNTKS